MARAFWQPATRNPQPATRMNLDAYQPIENYGIIGNLQTVALVGMHGSIDFLSFPYFDSPTVFAALLDHDKGGHFQIVPLLDQAKQKQLYLLDSNILLTRFLAPEGVAEISDFMPVSWRPAGRGRGKHPDAARPPRQDGARRDPLPRRVRAALRLRADRPHGGPDLGKGNHLQRAGRRPTGAAAALARRARAPRERRRRGRSSPCARARRRRSCWRRSATASRPPATRSTSSRTPSRTP